MKKLIATAGFIMAPGLRSIALAGATPATTGGAPVTSSVHTSAVAVSIGGSGPTADRSRRCDVFPMLCH